MGVPPSVAGQQELIVDRLYKLYTESVELAFQLMGTDEYAKSLSCFLQHVDEFFGLGCSGVVAAWNVVTRPCTEI